jgi:hypothetical protein
MIPQHGKDYSDTPARKLSQSFSLEIVGGKAITAKQVCNSLKISSYSRRYYYHSCCEDDWFGTSRLRQCYKIS